MILLVLDNTNIFLLLLFAEISIDFIKLHWKSFYRSLPMEKIKEIKKNMLQPFEKQQLIIKDEKTGSQGEFQKDFHKIYLICVNKFISPL